MTFFAYFCRAKPGDYINKVGKWIGRADIKSAPANVETLITRLANAGNI